MLAVGGERLVSAAPFEQGLDEIKRIIKLPVERSLTPEEVDEVSRVEITRAAYEGGYRLWRQQAESLLAFQGVGGLFAPLRVGFGKSVVAQLCIKDGFQRAEKDRILHLVPSRLFVKVVTRDVPKARREIGLQAPVHGLGGLPPARRLALARSGWRGVYVYPYSLLSEEQADEELGLIKPSLVVCDEVHALKGITSARTRRFLRMMSETKAGFVALSGTMAKKSLFDYWHLILLALGDRCPLPRQRADLERWASGLDVGGQVWVEEKREEDMRGLEPLRVWAIEGVRTGRIQVDDVGGPLSPDAQGYRRAFRLRRDTAPGVVASGEQDLGVSLSFVNVPALDEEKVKEKVKKIEEDLSRRFTGEEDFEPAQAFASTPPLEKLISLIWSARERSTTPNGDVIEFGIHGFKWAYELSTGGFFNELVWPASTEVAFQQKISQQEAEDRLERAYEHRKAERAYHKEVRRFLQGEHVPALDTPLLIASAASRDDGRLPQKVRRLYDDMKALDFEGRPLRIERTSRVCDFKVKAAVEWADRHLFKNGTQKKGAIVWVFNREVGEWASEEFEKAFGSDCILRCPAGARADREIQDPKNADKIAIASLSAHGEGKDLFHFQEQYYLQFPRSADLAEQSLGRLHRFGQEADELIVHTNRTLSFDHECFYATLCDSAFLHQVEGPQRLIYGDWPETPKRYPPEFLAQRGFDLLSKSGADVLEAVLGGSGDSPVVG